MSDIVLIPDRAMMRQATPDDIAVFFPDPPMFSMRAMAGIFDGEVVGLVGVCYPGGGRPPYVISHIREGHKAPPLTVMRGARAALRAMVTLPMFAAADPNHKGACRVLMALGFKFFAPMASGDVYRYDPNEVHV